MLSNILLTDRKRLVAMHAELGLLQSCICSAKVCFLHGMVPRGATVRARTEVDATAIPPSAAWRMLGSYFAYSEFWVSHLHFSELCILCVLCCRTPGKMYENCFGEP